jgi:phytoene dehydrogenase-like protein
MKYDYVVIGAGASGMTTALVLAKNGYRVALVEKYPSTGPLLNSFVRRGLRFETGFHYSGDFGKGQILDAFFRYLGLFDLVSTAEYNSSGYDVFRCRKPEFEFRFPFGYAALREKLATTFPDEQKAIKTYLQVVAKIKADMDDSILVAARPTAFLQRYESISLKSFLDSLTGNRLLKALLASHGILYGVAPEHAPMSLHAKVVGSYYLSTHGLIGGGESLVTAFSRRMEQAGVEILCGRGVQEILASQTGGLEGVRLEDGEVLECRGCISTVHPRTLLQLVPQGLFRSVYRKRLTELKESASGLILYAEIDSPVELLNGANLYLSEDPEAFFAPMDGPWQQRPLFVSAARRVTDDNQPQGFFSICMTPPEFSGEGAVDGSWHGSVNYRQAKERACQVLQAQIEKLCPELRDRVVYRELSTPQTLKRYTHSPSGSLYGVAHRIEQSNPLTITRIPGLFLAGQAIAGPGLLGVMISAFHACANVIGYEQLKKDVMKCN